MSKQYTADKIKNFLIRIKIATPDDPVECEGTYYAAFQKITAIGQNGDMEVNKGIAIKYYGTGKNDPWTAKEVGDSIAGFNNLNTSLYNDIKQLYLDILNEDIT